MRACARAREREIASERVCVRARVLCACVYVRACTHAGQHIVEVVVKKSSSYTVTPFDSLNSSLFCRPPVLSNATNVNVSFCYSDSRIVLI